MKIIVDSHDSHFTRSAGELYALREIGAYVFKGAN